MTSRPVTITLYVDPAEHGRGHRTTTYFNHEDVAAGCWTAIVLDGAQVKYHRFPEARDFADAEQKVRGLLRWPRRRIDWRPSGTPISAWSTTIAVR